MRSGPAALVGPLLAVALILPGCGDEQTTAAGTGSAPSKAAASGGPGAKESEARASDPAAAKRCRRSLGDFLDSIESLNNTLAVGLEYDDYLAAVNHVRSTYASVPADRLQLICLGKVASPAEQALNAYIDAANTWGDCLASTECDPESVEPELQRRWAKASDLLSSAQTGLRDLG